MNFIKANILNFIATVVLYGINLITGMIVARLLGVEDTGYFQIFNSTQTLIVAIFSLGLGQASTFYVNSKKVSLKRVLSTILKFEFFISLVVFFVTLCIISLNLDYFGEIPITSIILYSLGCSSLLFVTSLRPLLLANMKVVRNLLVQYISSFGVLVSIIVLFYLEHKINIDNLLNIYGVMNILSATLLLIYFIPYFNIKESFNKNLFCSIAKLGFFMSTNNIAFIFISSAPVYAMTLLLDDGVIEVGYFSRAISICTIATFVNKSIGPLLFAKLTSSSMLEKQKQMKLSASFFFLFNLFMIIVLEILAEHLIRLFYGNEFYDAVPMLRILLFTLIFDGHNSLTINLISSVGKPIKILYNFIIGLVVIIFLLPLCEKLFGVLGIPLAVLITTCITSLLLIRETIKLIDLSFSDFFSIKRDIIKECIIIFRNGLSK